MSKRLVFVLGIFLLLPCLMYSRFNSADTRALDGYSVHNVDTELDYATIQEAIDAPETDCGNTIVVDAGTYYENVVLNKPNLTLIGENKHTTVIYGNGNTTVSLKDNNTKIKGFTVQNGYRGILLFPNTHGHIISSNIISNNVYGILGALGYDCVDISICDNTITSNNNTGIAMVFSHSLICNNLISDNGKGLFEESGLGIQIAVGVNSEIIYCVNNTFFGNTIQNHEIGILATKYSEENVFLHNNFVNNTRQLAIRSTTWNNSLMENYWSDYNGIDANSDGIGDVSLKIDDNVQDKHPLMGMFSSFDTSLDCRVNVISNSTIEDFEYYESNSTIKMHISSMTANQTFGFCRICIPAALMSEPYHVTVDGAEPHYVNYTLYDYGDNRWIYFSYPHSELRIIIVPISPSLIIPPTFIIAAALAIVATLLAVIAHRRKHFM